MSKALETTILTPHSVSVLATVGAALSVLCVTTAMAVMGYEILMLHHPWHFHTHMTFILFAIDLISSLVALVEIALGDRWFGCQLLSRVSHISRTSHVLWSGFMAFQLHSWVVRGTSVTVLSRRVYPALAVTVIITLLNVVIWWAFIPKPMTLAEYTCWYPANPPYLRIGVMYVYVWVVMAYVLYVFYCLVWRLWRIQRTGSQRTVSEIHQAGRLQLGIKLSAYVIVFFLTWWWPLVNHTVQGITGKEVPALKLLLLFSLPFKGVWDAMVYGKVPQWCLSCSSVCGGSKPSNQPNKEDRLVSIQVPSIADVNWNSTFKTKQPSIFVTTFNCGGYTADGLDLELALPLWLALDHDLYIIGVQELKGLKRFRSVVHDYLGPKRYEMFSKAMDVVGGSSLADQLGCMAVTIFARTIDVLAGTFELLGGGEQLSQGVHLGVFRAGNKGGLCIPFRFHNLGIVVVGAHLHADGKCSRVNQRNEALRELLATVGQDFDVHLEHHHTILLGDLNYRLVGDPDIVLEKIAKAAQSSAKLADMETPSQDHQDRTHHHHHHQPHHVYHVVSQVGNWLQRRYAAVEVGGSAMEVCDDWKELLELDELMEAQAVGEVLHGFREGRISFPPSYRRVRGPDGDCLDYTDVERLALCYTTRLGVPSSVMTEDEEDDVDEEDNDRSRRGQRIRVPSWTDRIMVHSLPDVADELILQCYELCDAVYNSDHRPVCAVFRLNLMPAMKRRNYSFQSSLSSSFSRLPLDDTITNNNTANNKPPPPWQEDGGSPDSSSFPTLAHHPTIFSRRYPSMSSAPANSFSVLPAASLVFHIQLSKIQVNLDAHNSCVSSPEHSGFIGSNWSESDSSEVDGSPPVPSLSTMAVEDDAGITQLAVLFPLPMETCLENSLVVKRLDTALNSKRKSRGSGVVSGSSYVDWGVVRSVGVKIVAEVVLRSSDETLHALIKLIDGKGVPQAQGVIAIPRSTSRGKQSITVDLTLHSAYRGTLSCDLEVIKIQTKVPSLHELVEPSEE